MPPKKKTRAQAAAASTSATTANQQEEGEPAVSGLSEQRNHQQKAAVEEEQMEVDGEDQEKENGEEQTAETQSEEKDDVGGTFGTRVLACGSGDMSQLGHGTAGRTTDKKPRKLDLFEGQKIRKIAAGGLHSVVLTTGGDVSQFIF